LRLTAPTLWTANAFLLQVQDRNFDPDTGVATKFTIGFILLNGIIFGSSNIWVTDIGDKTLKKLDSNGNVIQSVAVGGEPEFPVFDGSNIWVPNQSNSITVVRARDGLVVATLTGNGLNGPAAVSSAWARL
jgi:hypothetical protein